MPADPDFEDRTLPRHAWPLRIISMSRASDDDLSGSTTVEQRLRFVESLSQEAWALVAAPAADYDRAHMPVRVVRGSR